MKEIKKAKVDAELAALAGRAARLLQQAQKVAPFAGLAQEHAQEMNVPRYSGDWQGLTMNSREEETCGPGFTNESKQRKMTERQSVRKTKPGGLWITVNNRNPGR